MDYAEIVELEAMALQGPMNAVIDLGASEIQKHYRGSTVFLTGATGFLGKLMIEKLLRSCDIKVIYVLLREKRGKNMQDRLDSITSEPLFDHLRGKQPSFAEKLVPVHGDISQLRLSLGDEDWKTLTNEVDTIYHYAATTKFDEPIKVATLINVRGTREVLKLAKECKKLRSLVHVSTAFCWTTRSRINDDVYEEFYQAPIAPDALIQLAESMDEDRLNNIEEALTDDWPNTYTFTKMEAEELVRTMGKDLPVCVVRPPIVVVPYYEPAPGWLDMHSSMGASGVLLGLGLGLIHVIYSRDVKFCYLPGDYATNATIAAGWDTAVKNENGPTDLKIYTFSNIRSKKEYSWGYFDKLLRGEEAKNLTSPKSIWYGCAILTDNKLFYWLLTWFLHYVPAYILQFVFYVFKLKMPKGLPANFDFVRLYTKIYKIGLQYGYFLTNEWKIHDNNTEELFNKMSELDRTIYNFDIHKIDWKKLLYVWGLGLRKYIVKDGLKDSERGRRKQQYLRVAHYIFMTLYIYAIWKIVSLFWSLTLWCLE
ncbi:hypothetical protein K1T71_004841 [Dendrolimus kikuchii]|uniref:Uncharacterized protein n=1 Tax=Dendrolimus kikuchii TaxID=765133 RepID=A0ACC1D5D4_9NEOP|nr:hypothetical protein K1T71_004841 [Dendrolimus kikuchii]